MALAVQPYSTPNIVSNGPGKTSFYSTVGQAASSLPAGATQAQINAVANKFANNPYGVSYQELQGQIAGGVPKAAVSGGGSGGSTAPAVNPFTTSFLASLPGQLGAIHQGASDAASNAHTGLGSSIGDLVANLQKEQNGIDQQSIQNELAKQQGTAGVLDMVKHGLQSGGVTLANANATNSSAAGALARAYGDIGRRAQSQVGGQYLQGQNAVQAAQKNEQIDLSSGVRDFQSQKTQSINQIVADAQNKLSYLASQAVSASVPNKVNIQAEMQQVRDQATNALSDLDAALSQQTGGIAPISQDAARAQANTLATGGTAAAAPFNYTSVGPAQFQNTGPAASQLPIYIAPGAKKTNG